MRAASAAKGLSSAASALIAEIPLSRLTDIEEGDQIPHGGDLKRFAEAHGIDSYSVFLWAVTDLAERLMNQGSSPPNYAQDEDLYEAWDRMVTFLAEQGRI
jgi:hypothetical protein